MDDALRTLHAKNGKYRHRNHGQLASSLAMASGVSADVVATSGARSQTKPSPA